MREIKKMEPEALDYQGKGYLRVSRKLLNALFSKDENEQLFGQVYLALVLNAYHTDGQVMLRNKMYVCHRGEFVGKRDVLMHQVGLKRTTLNGYLEKMKTKNLITIEPLDGGSRITVLNYEYFSFSGKKEAAAQPIAGTSDASAFAAMMAAERSMGGRSMQADMENGRAWEGGQLV